jgi:hypothetical protein
MRAIIILVLIFIGINVFGQIKKKDASPEESRRTNSNKFGRVSNISFSTRIKKYPFNKAVKICLVSFEDLSGGGQLDTTKIVYNQNMPKSNMAVCINSFKEIKTLSHSQINKLTDVLFNYKPIGKNHIIEFSSCYSPRNAILFLDENEKVFDFIEICFSCLHMRNFSKKFNVENECDHKINMIKEFFRSAGIKHGVVEEKQQ